MQHRPPEQQNPTSQERPTFATGGGERVAGQQDRQTPTTPTLPPVPLHLLCTSTQQQHSRQTTNNGQPNQRKRDRALAQVCQGQLPPYCKVHQAGSQRYVRFDACDEEGVPGDGLRTGGGCAVWYMFVLYWRESPIMRAVAVSCAFVCSSGVVCMQACAVIEPQ
jgi:hypothetical protein